MTAVEEPEVTLLLNADGKDFGPYPNLTNRPSVFAISSLTSLLFTQYNAGDCFKFTFDIPASYEY